MQTVLGVLASSLHFSWMKWELFRGRKRECKEERKGTVAGNDEGVQGGVSGAPLSYNLDMILCDITVMSRVLSSCSVNCESILLTVGRQMPVLF